MASISFSPDIARLYSLKYPSKKQYLDKSIPKDPRCSLHYLIHLEQSDQHILQFVKAYKRDHPVYLDYRDPKNRQLTPMMLAIIRGRINLVEELIKAGAKTNIQDAWGFTILHHAALRSSIGQEFSDLLERIKRIAEGSIEGIRHLLSRFGGSYEDIYRLVNPAVENQEETVCLLKNQQDELTKISRRTFHKMTQRYFAFWFRSSPENIIRIYCKPSDKCDYIHPKDPIVDRFNQHPPPIALKLYPQMGYGVETQEPLQEKTIVCFYVGELVAPDPPVASYGRTIYEMNGSDASVYANLASCINDGLPNCRFASIQDYRGLDTAKIVITYSPIKAGEQLFVDYGPEHPTKVGPYKIAESSFTTLSRYLATFGGFLGNLYLVIEQMEKGASSTQLHALPQRVLRYILSTPSVFIKLHLLRVLDIQNTHQNLTQGTLKDEIKSTEGTLPFFIDLYPQILGFLAKVHLHRDQQQIIAFIDRLSSQIRVEHFMKILILMDKDQNLDIKNLEKYGTLGSLLDDLYLFLHHTLVGSYTTNRVLAKNEKLPKVALNQQHILNEYSQLTVLQKEMFCFEVTIFISMALFFKLPSKAGPLKCLLELLLK